MGSCLSCDGGAASREADEDSRSCSYSRSHSHSAAPQPQPQPKDVYLTRELVDQLVLEALAAIGALVDIDQDPPESMQKLHHIAYNECGWMQVVRSMVRVLPMADPLSPSVITLLLDDCPLPSRDAVLSVVEHFQLSAAPRRRHQPTLERNVCIVLGCLAERLAGPSSVAMLTPSVLDYLLANLTAPHKDANVVLFSLIAMEKFAQTGENKATIKRRLGQVAGASPLLRLERMRASPDYVDQQVGFCAQWCLDNLFVIEGRPYSYESTDMSRIHALLNVQDVSEYLKISPDGLEARCDACSFESVRCTAQADAGVWYYEATIITPGVMQIGWATRDSNFLNHEGYGIGDDAFSVAYDGYRCLVWHDAKSEPQAVARWQPGDTLGCLLDLAAPAPCVVFSLNGAALAPCRPAVLAHGAGFFAAASFMSFQQCRFNFGSRPFRHPPPAPPFATFNESRRAPPEAKQVVPRHLLLQKLQKQSIGEDSCTLCFDRKASVRLIPCNHGGFCSSCADQLTECPMCRSTFELMVDSP